jgi:hypothetical protein
LINIKAGRATNALPAFFGGASGMSRVLKLYDRSIFSFTPNFLTASFPIEEGPLIGRMNIKYAL